MHFLRCLLVAIMLSQGLTGCSWLSATIADHLPTWAGGLPANAPPRPDDPRYAELKQKSDIVSDTPLSKNSDVSDPIH